MRGSLETLSESCYIKLPVDCSILNNIERIAISSDWGLLEGSLLIIYTSRTGDNSRRFLEFEG